LAGRPAMAAAGPDPPGRRQGAGRARWPRCCALALLALMTATEAPGRPTTTFAMPSASTVRTPPRTERWQGGNQRGGRGPQRIKEYVEITHVGQELRGWVRNVNATKSGAAFVNVGRGRPVMLLPDDMAGPVEPGMAFPVYVKQIVADGHVLVSMQGPKKTVQSLEVGESVSGVVTNIADFGAIFLDVGADADGCLLAGQMDVFTRRRMNSGSLKLGDTLRAFVKDLRADGNFGLTMMRPSTPMGELKVGQEYFGTVVKVNPSVGAFVDIGSDTSGWIPEHELQDKKVQLGQQVTVWIQEVRKDRGVQLSLDKPRVSLESLKVGAKLQGTVTGFPPFGGAFVDVGAVRDGIVNKEEVADKRGERTDLPVSEVLQIGQKIEVWVKQRRGDWSMQLTMVMPKVSKRSLHIGKRMTGKIVKETPRGDFFLDIGYVNDVMLRKSDMVGLAPADMEYGKEIDVWIKAVHRDAAVDVTMEDIKADPDSRKWWATPRRGIV